MPRPKSIRWAGGRIEGTRHFTVRLRRVGLGEPEPAGVVLGAAPACPRAADAFGPGELALRLAVYAARAARGEPVTRGGR
jgi:hypothetical protein